MQICWKFPLKETVQSDIRFWGVKWEVYLKPDHDKFLAIDYKVTSDIGPICKMRGVLRTRPWQIPGDWSGKQGPLWRCLQSQDMIRMRQMGGQTVDIPPLGRRLLIHLRPIREDHPPPPNLRTIRGYLSPNDPWTSPFPLLSRSK